MMARRSCKRLRLVKICTHQVHENPHCRPPHRRTALTVSTTLAAQPPEVLRLLPCFAHRVSRRAAGRASSTAGAVVTALPRSPGFETAWTSRRCAPVRPDLLNLLADLTAELRSPVRRVKRIRARPGREGGRALIVHATAGQRLDTGSDLGGSKSAGSAGSTSRFTLGYDRVRRVSRLFSGLGRVSSRRRWAAAGRRERRPGRSGARAAPGRPARTPSREPVGGRPRPGSASRPSPAPPGR